MSEEVIEAVYRYSSNNKKQLMLICSRNQIDVKDGYVFHTWDYMDYVQEMQQLYPLADVVICRDHCGPGFGPNTEHDLEGTKETIECDIEHGFDLIHIDLCLAEEMSHLDKIDYTLELMRHAQSLRPNIMFEIGTDENVGVAERNIDRIIRDIKACQQVANPEFYVVQTGSLVWECSNSGRFDRKIVKDMHDAIARCGTKLKEHNADYLSTSQIESRRGIVDAMNIAPQLGVVQTSHILSQAIIYGIDSRPFVAEVAAENKWKKWSDDFRNHHLCALIGGHYHFKSQWYKELVEQLVREIDIRESIICEITKVIDHYSLALE